MNDSSIEVKVFQCIIVACSGSYVVFGSTRVIPGSLEMTPADTEYKASVRLKV